MLVVATALGLIYSNPISQPLDRLFSPTNIILVLLIVGIFVLTGFILNSYNLCPRSRCCRRRGDEPKVSTALIGMDRNYDRNIDEYIDIDV